MKEDNEKPLEIERNQNAEKLVSILSLLPESAIVPKNRLIVYSGIEKYGKTKLIRPAESAFIFLDEINLLDVLEKGKSVRIHPLLREYVLEKLQKESTTNLRVESILNLKRAYYDNFPSLVQEYLERNGDIDSIREDFEIVLLWSKVLVTVKDSDSIKLSQLDMEPIYQLNKVLEQESHNLRLAENDLFTYEDKSVLFVQRMLIRSIDLNYTTIVDKSRRFLSLSKKPFLDLLWAKVYNKEALIMTLEGHSDSVISVAVTSDNSKIVSRSRDKTIKVWDLNTGRLLNTLEGHSDSVTFVKITSDNSKIVSVSYETWGRLGYNPIKVWDLNTGELLNTLQDHSRFWVSSIAITRDNSKIVSESSGSEDNAMKVWDLNTGRLLNTLEMSVTSVVSPDNSKIISGSGYSTIKVWDLNTGRLLNTLEGHTNNVSSIVVSSDNSKIISGSRDKTIKVWDLNTGRLLNTLAHSGSVVGYSGGVKSVAITQDNSKIVSGSGDDTIKVWDLNTGRLINTLQGHFGVTSVAITSDNSKIVSGSHDNAIKVWDLNTERLLNTLAHSDSVRSVAITSDNSKIVSGSEDNTIKVWNLIKGNCYLSYKFDESSTSLTLSKDGNFIAIGGLFGGLYLGSLSA